MNRPLALTARETPLEPGVRNSFGFFSMAFIMSAIVLYFGLRFDLFLELFLGELLFPCCCCWDCCFRGCFVEESDVRCNLLVVSVGGEKAVQLLLERRMMDSNAIIVYAAAAADAVLFGGLIGIFILRYIFLAEFLMCMQFDVLCVLSIKVIELSTGTLRFKYNSGVNKQRVGTICNPIAIRMAVYGSGSF